jgi:uncharacterized protein with HEPN domain
MKDDTAYLRLMLDSFAKISSYIAAMSYTDFEHDSKTQSAVIMQLQVVGELAKRISDQARRAINAPWKDMAGLRDLVSHNYFSLDLQTIWLTAKERAPIVEQKVREYAEKAL